MNTDDPIGQALEQLRISDASQRPSNRVEQGVFAAFEAHSRRSTGRMMAVVVAVAATVVAAISYLLVIAPSPIAPAGHRISDLPTVVKIVERPGTPARSSEPETPTVIRTLGSIHDTHLQTVHGRVPRSYLPLLGIPDLDPDARGTVGIEVVVGEDGLRKAIRIVQ